VVQLYESGLNIKNEGFSRSKKEVKVEACEE
jgi:hypothetical protein